MGTDAEVGIVSKGRMQTAIQAAQKSLLMAADHDEKAILGGLQQVLLLLSCYQPLRVMCPGRTHRDSSAVCMHKCMHGQICKKNPICFNVLFIYL